jgi:hypothetical protein
MHGAFLALSALDLARERSLEADRRARLLQGAGPFPRTLPRRVLERLAAWATGGGRPDNRLSIGGDAV